MKRNTKKILNSAGVKPRRKVCIHRNALQKNCVPSIEITLTTAHGLGRNGTSNIQTRNIEILMYSVVCVSNSVIARHKEYVGFTLSLATKALTESIGIALLCF